MPRYKVNVEFTVEAKNYQDAAECVEGAVLRLPGWVQWPAKGLRLLGRIHSLEVKKI